MNKWISALTTFEKTLWILSVTAVVLSFILSGSDDILTCIASLIGVTALIYVAKGFVIGQVLTVVFSVFYGIISFYFRYYGEMITYLGMTSPIAILSIISWLRHPYKDTGEVKVHKMTGKQISVMALLTVLTTTAFYFILKSFNTANLPVSTLSVTTSFLAAYLTFMRSPYYGLFYASNNVVLIVLWILASLKDKSYIPMVVCFLMFLLNDLYGFVNWKRMQKRQK